VQQHANELPEKKVEWLGPFFSLGTTPLLFFDGDIQTPARLNKFYMCFGLILFHDWGLRNSAFFFFKSFVHSLLIIHRPFFLLSFVCFFTFIIMSNNDQAMFTSDMWSQGLYPMDCPESSPNESSNMVPTDDLLGQQPLPHDSSGSLLGHDDAPSQIVESPFNFLGPQGSAPPAEASYVEVMGEEGHGRLVTQQHEFLPHSSTSMAPVDSTTAVSHFTNEGNALVQMVIGCNKEFNNRLLEMQRYQAQTMKEMTGGE
jgi:hypothetical protein